MSWLNITPATVDTTTAKPMGVTLTQQKHLGYVVLPMFNYSALQGTVSRLVTQFNYTISGNVALQTPSVVPAGINFSLCVRSRVGAAVTRYMLWRAANSTIYAPDYAGQTLGKNIVLEVWKTNPGTTVSNNVERQLNLTLLHVPTFDTDTTQPLEALSVEALPVGHNYPTDIPTSLGTGTAFISN